MEASTQTPDQCAVCFRTDTDPKHTTGYVGPDNVAVPSTRHFDCCSAAGCPGGSCTRTLQLSGYLKGDALRKWIISGGAQQAAS